MDHVTMIERKLSGVYTKVEVEIPYTLFETYVDHMHQQLDSHGIVVDIATLFNDPKVVEQFDLEITLNMADHMSESKSSIGDPWSFADKMFSADIQKKKDEQLELMRKAIGTAKEENSLDKAIPIRKMYRSRAIELLKEAGFYDEHFAGVIEPKLKRQFGNDESQ